MNFEYVDILLTDLYKKKTEKGKQGNKYRNLGKLVELGYSVRMNLIKWDSTDSGLTVKFHYSAHWKKKKFNKLFYFSEIYYTFFVKVV